MLKSCLDTGLWDVAPLWKFFGHGRCILIQFVVSTVGRIDEPSIVGGILKDFHLVVRLKGTF